MFSEDADSPINLVEIQSLHYSCVYWEFPRIDNSQVGGVKYFIIGPCIPSETTKSWHHGERGESDENSKIFCDHVNFPKMNGE